MLEGHHEKTYLSHMQKPGVLELIQQRQLAGGDDVFYASTGRWYTHNCTGFEVPPYNSSLNALGLHYKVSGSNYSLARLSAMLLLRCGG